MRGRAVFAGLVAVAMVACGCRAAQGVASAWPYAAGERTSPGPGGPPRWPLTGLPAPSVRATRLRVVAVKVDESPQGRPQSGLGRADIVYETMAEGGLTRLTALFHSSAPAAVGPVRSARAVDLYLAAQYHALFAHDGAESAVGRALADRTRYSDLARGAVPAAYTRSSSRSAPYNLYVDVGAARVAGARRGLAVSRTVEGPAFAQAPPTSTVAVRQVDITYSTLAKVEWRLDGRSDSYQRFVNGRAEKDAVTRAQYVAQNVVVIWTQESPRAHRDAAGRHALDIALVGSGRTSVFRDGVHADGRWQADASSPVVLTTADGRLIKLKPGTTWYEVVANDQDVIMR